jgi:hypothetical protein
MILMSDGDAVQGEPQNGTKKKKLPLKDKIMMGPLDKYQKYSKQKWRNFVQIVFLGSFLCTSCW